MAAFPLEPVTARPVPAAYGAVVTTTPMTLSNQALV